MNAVEPNLTPEQFAVCERLTPHIVTTTENYFTPGRIHPYMDGLASGGTVQEDPEHSTPNTQAYVVTEATGFRDTLEPEKFPRIGIPESVAMNGLLWVVMTDRHYYPAKPQGKRTQPRDRMDHSFAYWDSNQWHVRRLIPGSEPGEGAWEDMWQSSELKENEIEALKVTAAQTEDMHALAGAFNEDSHSVERALIRTARDERTRNMLRLGVKPPLNTQNYQTMTAYMHYYATAYQYMGSLLRVAHRLDDGRSFELDSSGIMAADYHRSSMPSTPEMLQDGENIVVGRMHPPLPPDMLRYYRKQPSAFGRLIEAVLT